MTTKQTVSRVRAGYQKANEEAAGIILQDVAFYGGGQALPVVWARLTQAKKVRRIEGPLFSKQSRAA